MCVYITVLRASFHWSGVSELGHAEALAIACVVRWDTHISAGVIRTSAESRVVDAPMSTETVWELELKELMLSTEIADSPETEGVEPQEDPELARLMQPSAG